MRWLAILALAFFAFGIVGLALADGGAPPARPQPGVKEWRPVVERWSFVSIGGPEMGGRLCDDATPCRAEALDAAAAAGMSCMLEARVWLAGSWGEPLVLRDVEGSAYVVVWAGAGELREDGVLNGSTHLSTFPLAWDGGWWWKAESERMRVSVPAPCDARDVKVTLQFFATDLLGQRVPHPETFEVRLVEEA